MLHNSWNPRTINHFGDAQVLPLVNIGGGDVLVLLASVALGAWLCVTLLRSTSEAEDF